MSAGRKTFEIFLSYIRNMFIILLKHFEVTRFA